MTRSNRICRLCGLAVICGFLLAPALGIGEVPITLPHSSVSIGAVGVGTLALGWAPPAKDAETDKVEGDDPSSPEISSLRKLTEKEISRIRFMELRGMRVASRKPDRVMVKVPQKAVEDFLKEMEGHPDFRGDKARRAFRKCTPAQKLHYIAHYTKDSEERSARFADRVEIKSDPEVFVEFRQNIMPIVLRGCASPKCHNSANESELMRLRFFKDPKKSASTTYANFLVLNEAELGLSRLIDRGQPENSLLLTFMLPSEEVKMGNRHPGEMKMKPVFRSRKARGFKRILKWISSLKHPAGDYGVRLSPMGASPKSIEEDAAIEKDETESGEGWQDPPSEGEETKRDKD